MNGVQRVYVLINCVTGSSPYVLNILKANPYIDTIIQSNRDNEYAPKKFIERAVFPMPAGARVRMLPYDLPLNFFTAHTEPDGPSVFDRRTESYLAELKNKTPMA